ncbi:MAG: hypothetical protein ABSD20_07115, partial [Terriglobales bacterium]
MAEGDLSGSSTTGGLPVDSSLGPALQSLRAPIQVSPVNLRTVYVSAVSILLAGAAALVARLLVS